MARSLVEQRFSFAGWSLKEFLLGNKEAIKLAIALAIAVLGPLSPELNIVAAALGKAVLDIIDYWQAP